MDEETCRWDQEKRAKLSCWYRELWGCSGSTLPRCEALGPVGQMDTEAQE